MVGAAPGHGDVVAGYWGLQLRRESEALGLLATGQKGRSVLTGIAVLTVASPIALCLGLHGGLHDAIAVSSWFTLLPLGLLLYSWAQRTRALTVKGCELAGGYEALGRYMATFGRLQEKPAEAVVLWEQYLTLAVVLGLADETVDELYIMPPSFAEYGKPAAAAGWPTASVTRRACRIPPKPRRTRDSDAPTTARCRRRGWSTASPTRWCSHPSLGLAERSVFARHGVGARRLAG